MRFDIITIFPKIFNSYLEESLVKRAQKKGIIKIFVHNLRGFTSDKHKKVDDSPFGGGPGMVLKIEPIYKAVGSILRIFNFSRSKDRGSSTKSGQFSISKHKKSRVILFSTRGKKFDSKTAKRLSKYDQLILICGRYEGVDERVAKYIADEEISVGDYVLSGGELPALILIESVSRFLKGFLGKQESLEEIKGSYPVFTRPEIFIPPPPPSLIRANRRIRKHEKVVSSTGKRLTVPRVLLSGDHKKIKEWRGKRDYYGTI